ncbi:glycosyltransferase family 2 protein [Flavobacterium frigidarium]|uniref:glycosyltransferase family 2 protein n=1 Tax=Flavobacterium frigidarium TaxID=99286 RepID=UPI0030DC7DBE|tara:strand:+ start:988 stop:1809 length:822 start_codon:yes stop_codon:yes gene_type:complete
MKITASIVIYNTELTELSRVIDSVFNGNINLKLCLIDNSFKDTLKQQWVDDDRIIYIHNPSNPGFGAAHNLGIQIALNLGSKYHFIINPDVFFERDVISKMIDYMHEDPLIGMMMPQILNVDGSIQNLPKLLPSPYSVLMRKIKWPKNSYNTFINSYELRSVDKKIIYNAPILSGCFTLLNLEAVKKVGMYDDAFFMYFEDWDLSRRMNEKYKTLYFPAVSVYHGYESGANKSSKLFKIFLNSAFTYFNKWGWFFDSERGKVNKRTLAQFTIE